MSQAAIPVVEGSLTTPKVRKITLDDPWQWLAKGWKDTLHTPLASITYGAIFVVMGYLLVQLVQAQFHFVLVLTAGFFLVGPFLATGLYDMSKRIEEGEKPSLIKALTAWRGNVRGILLFGLGIGFIMAFWVRLSAVLFAVLFAADSSFTVGRTIETLFFTGQGFAFLGVFMAVGGLFAAIVYCLSAVSIPMLVDDKHSDMITAVVTSVTAVRHNIGPMILWAGLIVLFVGAGLLLFYIGLAVAMPVIGHGTWHAYRALVERSDLPLEVGND